MALKVKDLYLVGYNVVAAVLWGLTLFRAVNWCIAVLENGGFQDRESYASFQAQVLPFLIPAQSVALLEIVHSLTRLVSSPILTTTLQVLSRIFVLYGFLIPVHIVHPGVALCVISWSLVEIPRFDLLLITALSQSLALDMLSMLCTYSTKSLISFSGCVIHSL
jgi:hypothetical protein